MTGELSMVQNNSLDELARLQVKQQSLQTHIMTLLAEQRRDLDAAAKMATHVKYAVEETRTDYWGMECDSPVC